MQIKKMRTGRRHTCEKMCLNNKKHKETDYE